MQTWNKKSKNFSNIHAFFIISSIFIVLREKHFENSTNVNLKLLWQDKKKLADKK